MPRVSTSIPCYNATTTPQKERWLRTSIESVLDQTMDDFELLLIDDGSTDGTAEVLQEHLDDPRVQYIYQDNQGYPGARNTGLERGDGEYFAFIGQDDRWYPEKLERQLEVLRSTDADLLHTNVYHIDGDDEITGIRRDKRPPAQDDGEAFIRQLYLGNFICIQSVLVHHSVIEGHRFDEELQINCDHDMWMRLAGECDIRYLDECLLEKRYHGANTSGNYERIFGERQYVADKAVDLYPFLEPLWGEKMGDAYLMYGIELLKRGDVEQARQSLRTAIEHDRTNWKSYATFLLSFGGQTLGSPLVSYLSNPRPGSSVT